MERDRVTAIQSVGLCSAKDHALIPVGVDLGVLALLAWDLLAEYLSLPWPVLRMTAWAFIGATVYLNVAAHENPTAAVMHAAMPVLFVTVIEGWHRGPLSRSWRRY